MTDIRKMLESIAIPFVGKFNASVATMRDAV